jgi:hypothetical protein
MRKLEAEMLTSRLAKPSDLLTSDSQGLERADLPFNLDLAWSLHNCNYSSGFLPYHLAPEVE